VVEHEIDQNYHNRQQADRASFAQDDDEKYEGLTDQLFKVNKRLLPY